MVSSITNIVEIFTVMPIMKEIMELGGLYLIWSFIHWGIAELYYKFCVSKKWYEIILTPLYLETPQCRILNWLHGTTISSINSMSATLITWGSKFVLSNMFTNKKTHMSGSKTHNSS